MDVTKTMTRVGNDTALTISTTTSTTTSLTTMRMVGSNKVTTTTTTTTDLGEEEVSDEYMQKEMTKGLLETLEEVKKSGKELIDLKMQYRQLYEAITSSLPEKIELSKTSLKEAFRQFYGTDVSEFINKDEIIESNVAGPSDL